MLNDDLLAKGAEQDEINTLMMILMKKEVKIAISYSMLTDINVKLCHYLVVVIRVPFFCISFSSEQCGIVCNTKLIVLMEFE